MKKSTFKNLTKAVEMKLHNTINFQLIMIAINKSMPLQIFFLTVSFVKDASTSYVEMLKNFKVHYRKKILSLLLSKIDQASSVYDFSKKLTVLDALVWTRAAIAEISTKTVTNSFKS